ncbi:hypothetical protein C8039_04535 [Halogeometricum sp. wsp3]|nr:hypothetical protein C8039_04535 [Halogeometricum sp. wsp3]
MRVVNADTRIRSRERSERSERRTAVRIRSRAFLLRANASSRMSAESEPWKTSETSLPPVRIRPAHILSE